MNGGYYLRDAAKPCTPWQEKRHKRQPKLNMAEVCPPIDPIKFRDDVLELMDQAEEESLLGPGFDFWMFAGIRLHHKYVRSREDFAPGAISLNDSDNVYCRSASMRIAQLMKVIKKANFEELVHSTTDGCRDVHLALFEAAAVVPYCEGKKFLTALRTEALKRKIEIDSLDRLLPE